MICCLKNSFLATYSKCRLLYLKSMITEVSPRIPLKLKYMPLITGEPLNKLILYENEC